MADLENGELSVQGQEKERDLLCQAEAPKPEGHYKDRAGDSQMIQCCNEETAEQPPSAPGETPQGTQCEKDDSRAGASHYQLMCPGPAATFLDLTS